MLNELVYEKIPNKLSKKCYGMGDASMGIVTAFAVIAIITVVIYKIYGSKTGDLTLPGGFKLKFTT